MGGTVKMNIDTDTQWAFLEGLRSYEAEFRPYLQGQIGNPDGDEKPNKKYYDPRMALRRGEEFMAKRFGRGRRGPQLHRCALSCPPPFLSRECRHSSCVPHCVSPCVCTRGRGRRSHQRFPVLGVNKKHPPAVLCESRAIRLCQ